MNLRKGHKIAQEKETSITTSVYVYSNNIVYILIVFKHKTQSPFVQPLLILFSQKETNDMDKLYLVSCFLHKTLK